MKVAVLFGGKSSEHNISIVSGTSVISKLDKKKYDIYPIYISMEGLFYKYKKNIEDIKILKIDEEIVDIELIDNIFEYLKNVDVVFPVLHGLNGEDGTIQGLLELIGKPYVGCGILSSSLCMDKVYTKRILKSCGINQAKSMYIKKEQDKYFYINDNFDIVCLSVNELIGEVENYLKFPVFIKPSKSGSSVGVHKCLNKNDFQKYLEDAFKYDNKVLIEEAILGREVECAVLGNQNLIVSNIGEVKTNDEFYSYDSKYKNQESHTIIPAHLDGEIVMKIQNIAKKAYLACDCKGLSRIDFFIQHNTNKIVLNEINTMPGFTEISMYSKLMEHAKISYSDLLDHLINLACQPS